MLKKIMKRVEEPTTLLGLILIGSLVLAKLGIISQDPSSWMGYVFGAFFILNPEK